MKGQALVVAVFCLVWVLPARPAQACSPPCGATVLPAAGEVPANLPGILFSYLGPAVSVPYDEAIIVTEVLPDGAESAVPLAVEPADPWWLARFGRPLVPGATYRVAVASACVSDHSWSETSFRAVAAAPLPGALGTVRVASSHSYSREVWTTSGSCSARADIVARALTLELDPAAIPWVHALDVRWLREDGIFASALSATDAAQDPEELWREWSNPTLYHVCDADDDGVDPGMPEGTTLVHAVGRVPGGASSLSTPAVEVSLDCGCGSGATSRAPSIAALALLLFLRRRYGSPLGRHRRRTVAEAR